MASIKLTFDSKHLKYLEHLNCGGGLLWLATRSFIPSSESRVRWKHQCILHLNLNLAKYFYFKYEKFYLLWILSLGTKAKCISGTLNRVISQLQDTEYFLIGFRSIKKWPEPWNWAKRIWFEVIIMHHLTLSHAYVSGCFFPITAS